MKYEDVEIEKLEHLLSDISIQVLNVDKLIELQLLYQLDRSIFNIELEKIKKQIFLKLKNEYGK